MTVSISPVPRKQYIDANGNPASGYKLFFYAAGSTTKQDTYTTSAGSVANANPITLDSEGRTPYAVWFTDGLSYKEVLAPPTDTDPPSSGVLMGDNLLGSGAATVTQSEWVLQPLTPTYISASSFSVPGDQTGEFHVGRRIKATVSGGTAYGFIKTSAYTSLTTVTIQYDSTPLDSGLSEVSVGIISTTNNSLPNADYLFNAGNKVINGKFRVAQAGTSFAAAVNGAYDLDGWLNGYVTSAVMTIAQDTASVPSTGMYARKVTFTTADAAIAAGDYITQSTRIEGYDAVDLLNNDFTIGFWVRSAVTGTHCVCFYNGTSTYVAEYSISVANTWEYKTVTVLGGTTALASTSNAQGLIIRFSNACGSTFQTTAGSWQAGNFFGTSNQVNDAATINNTFYLSGVTLNQGLIALSDYSSYERDLAHCQRYYQRLGSLVSAYGAAGQTYSLTYNYPVQMCATPTATISGASYSNASGAGIDQIANNKCRLYFTVTALGASTCNTSYIELDARI